MGLLVCMVVMLLLMESGLIKVFAAGALLGLWLGCMRMVESESVKERKAGARVRLWVKRGNDWVGVCLLYTSPSPRDLSTSRMPSSA